MGHKCCSKQKIKRGLWSPEEDEKLLNHIITHGHGSWSSVPKLAGLQRCGKSCRLRWINYLRPDLKRGSFTEEEEQIIIDVHRILGNRWAQIAKHLPGRTDNEVKNFWNSCIKKKLMSQGLDPKTHNLIPSHLRPSNSKKNKNTNTVVAFTISQPQCYEQHNSNVNAPMEVISRPPVLTLPSIPPSSINGHHQQSLQPQAFTNSEPQNPNFYWTGCARSSQDSTFCPYGSSNTESVPNSCNLVPDPSGFGDLDENFPLFAGTNTNTIPQTFEPPTISVEGTSQHQQQEQQEKEKIYEMQIDEPIGSNTVQDMDSSFGSCSGFDFEFMESALMSGSMMCRDLSSVSVDDFAWNF